MEARQRELDLHQGRRGQMFRARRQDIHQRLEPGVVPNHQHHLVGVGARGQRPKIVGWLRQVQAVERQQLGPPRQRRQAQVGRLPRSAGARGQDQ